MYKNWEEMGDLEADTFLYDLMDLAQTNNVQPNEIIKFVDAQRRAATSRGQAPKENGQ